MDSLDRVAAWFGVAISVVGLGWQIITWRMNRHHVKVKVANALSISNLGQTEHCIVIEVFNVGKDPISVSNWWIAIKRKGNLVCTVQHPWSQNLPAFLAPNHSAKFYLHAEEARRASAETGVPFTKMNPWVQLSNGSYVRSRKPLPLT